jgi:hypothetical protein
MGLPNDELVTVEESKKELAIEDISIDQQFWMNKLGMSGCLPVEQETQDGRK